MVIQMLLTWIKVPRNILCDKLSLYEYRGNLSLSKNLRKINVLKKKKL